MRTDHPHLLLVDGGFDQNNQFHIYEFGCGVNSNFSNYDKLHPEQPAGLLYRQGIEKIGESFDTVLIVAPYKTENIIPEGEKFKFIALMEYAGMGTNELKDTTEIENDPALMETIHSYNTEKCCYVIVESDSLKTGADSIELREFLRTHGSDARVINSDPGTIALAESKLMFHLCSNVAQLPSLAVNIHETPLQTIIDEVNSRFSQRQRVVIKPPHDSGGEGVFSLTVDEAIDFLHFLQEISIQISQQGGSITRKSSIEMAEQHGLDHIFIPLFYQNEFSSETLIIQALNEAPKTANRTPTIRAVFTHYKGEIKLVGAYKKFPNEQNIKNVFSRRAFVSNIEAEPSMPDKDELALLNQQLPELVLPILNKATETHFTAFIDKQPDHFQTCLRTQFSSLLTGHSASDALTLSVRSKFMPKFYIYSGDTVISSNISIELVMYTLLAAADQEKKKLEITKKTRVILEPTGIPAILDAFDGDNKKEIEERIIKALYVYADIRRDGSGNSYDRLGRAELARLITTRPTEIELIRTNLDNPKLDLEMPPFTCALSDIRLAYETPQDQRSLAPIVIINRKNPSKHTDTDYFILFARFIENEDLLSLSSQNQRFKTYLMEKGQQYIDKHQDMLCTAKEHIKNEFKKIVDMQSMLAMQDKPTPGNPRLFGLEDPSTASGSSVPKTPGHGSS